jgi:hypothetical protein
MRLQSGNESRATRSTDHPIVKCNYWPLLLLGPRQKRETEEPVDALTSQFAEKL